MIGVISSVFAQAEWSAPAIDWHAIAPDWRGYGLTQWSGADSYWFPDYLADLDAHIERDEVGEEAVLVEAKVLELCCEAQAVDQAEAGAVEDRGGTAV